MIEAPVLVIKRIYIYIFYYTNTYIYSTVFYIHILTFVSIFVSIE